MEYYQDRYYVKVYIEDMKISRLKDDRLNYYYSLYNTTFPLKSIFYTNLDVENEMELTTQEDFDGLILYNGRKFIGRLDTSISNLLILLDKYYGWKFKIKVEKVTKTTTHNIVEIIVKRDYSFECFDYNEIGIFKKIKNFLIKDMEYNTYTKKLLSSFYKDKKNLIIENKNQNVNLFLLTLGIYYFYKLGKKSQIIVKNIEKNNYDTKFIQKYFKIKEMKDFDENTAFTVFYGFEEKEEIIEIIKKYYSEEKNENEELKVAEINEISLVKENIEIKKNDTENKKRFCIILEENFNLISQKKLKNKEISVIKDELEIPENIIFLSELKKEERKKLKNIYVEYLPFEEKMELKKKLEENEKIYCDNSVFEIL